MSQTTFDVPEVPGTHLSEEPTLEQAVAELRNLRLWCGQVYMLFKDMLLVAADARDRSLAASNRVGEFEKNYVDVSNKLNNLDETMSLVVEAVLPQEEQENATN